MAQRFPAAYLSVRSIALLVLAAATATTSVATRATEPRTRRVLYNFDGDSCLWTRAGGKGPVAVGPDDVRKLLEEVAYDGSQVDSILVCINAQAMYYPTQVGTMRGTHCTAEERANWPDHEQQRFANLQTLFDSGVDPYAVLIAESRRRGREALLTFRMNDDHGNDFLRTRFWAEHPEYRLGRGALDFSHAEVRDYVAGLIEEAVQRYDADGIELDFNRFPHFFAEGSIDENVARMSGLVQRVRTFLDKIGSMRNRRLVLAVRAPSNFGRTPPTPETARALGCDVRDWVQKGWVDFVTVSEFFIERGDLPIGLWKQAISTVPIYGGIECLKERGRKNLSANEYRQAASQLVESQADGIYLFNFFTSREQGPESYEPPFDVLRDLVKFSRQRVGDATEIADIAGIEAEWNLVQQRLERLRAQPGIDLDAWADAHLFVKGVRWAIDFEPSLDEQERQLLRAALRRANERAGALAEGNSPWTELKGQMVRGFVSAIDGSTQPYGLVVPAGYDPGKPTRLDVVLHGSRRATGLGELLFINGFDLGDREIAADATQEGNPPASGAKSNYIELHPMGRLGENAYRFEGETDVDEAIEAVCRHYAVDRRRIVLRGSSLGGVGAWQLGLKRPDRYVALGPTAGPVDTVQFARSPWPHFVPLDPFTPWQQTTLSLVDPVGYAANAGMVPVVAAMGDQDPYYPAQAQMERACEQAGVSITALVDRGAGHSITDNMKAEQMRLLDEHAARPLEPVRRRIRFVTWTLKFPRCHWIELLRLDAHYQRAEIDARIEAGGAIRIREAKNVSRFAIHAAELESQPLTVFVGETACAVPPMQAAPRATHRVIVFSRKSGVWGYEGELDQLPLAGKRPGLQGPIDDAFAAPFLCVRGTGEAWHPHVSRWAEASLRRWAYEWRRHYRGELRIKDDRDVTEEDLRRYHLILFGDPGSNSWLGRMAEQLPIRWSREAIRAGAKTFSSPEHGLQLIFPNPLPAGSGRYVVVNSGHTYHAPELRLSYMAFPRLGDWAIVRAGENPSDSQAPVVAETVLASGFFDEDWKLK